MPIEVPPMLRYDLPRTIATPRPALAKRRSFSSTSGGIEASDESWTSCP